MTRMLEHFQTLLEAAIQEPDRRLSQLALPGLQSPPYQRQTPAKWAACPRSDRETTPYVAPRSEVERRLAAIWAKMLGVDQIGVHDDFFDLGGDSLLAVRVMTRVCDALGVDLPAATLFLRPTIARLAVAVEAARPGRSETEPIAMPLVEELTASHMTPSRAQGQSLVPLRTDGTAPPLFCIHGLGGHIATLLPLAHGLAPGRPVYGLQGQGLDAGQTPHDRIEDMAACYLREIRGVQSRGPYWLAGWSMGGVIALEAARQLTAAGEEVPLLAMFDTYLSLPEFERLDLSEQSVIGRIAEQLDLSAAELGKLPLQEQWERIAEQASRAGGLDAAAIWRLAAVCKAHLVACSQYQGKRYEGTAVLFLAEADRSRPERRWKSFCPRLRVEAVPGNHYSMLRKPQVDALAERLGRYLAETTDGKK